MGDHILITWSNILKFDCIFHSTDECNHSADYNRGFCYTLDTSDRE